MIKFSGTCFDGKTSKAHSVEVFFDEEFLRVRSEDGGLQLDVRLQDSVITPPLGKARRSIILPGGTRCETDDLGAISALESRMGQNLGMRVVHYLESRWKTVTCCVAGLIICIWAFIGYGIPFFAKKAADSIPPSLTEEISRETLEVLDKRFLAPSELAAEEVERLKEIFQKLKGEVNADLPYRIEFRKSPLLGPNAFALPSGLIVATDELVELAEDDVELVGVLVHEMAHVEKRHGLRSILQNAGVFLLVAALVGDVASITSAAASLPTILAQSGYSRKFEKEADEAAALYLIQKGWTTKPYQDILLRLSESRPKFPGPSLLSSHPDIAERLNYLQELERDFDGGIRQK
jgi:Zn-dependent protease with chaperone function